MKLLFKLIFRILQFVAIAFFGFWLYLKLSKTGLDFAVIMITTLPTLIIGLAIGTIITMIFNLRDLTSKNTALKFYDFIMILSYLVADCYFLNFIF